MAGYTRQSIADIVNGLDITAPPLTAEFNQIDAAFHATTGHAHDGSSGNAPKINLATSIQGYLPAAHGGVGGRNKTDATVAPAVTNDNLQGYAPGSIWVNTTTGRIYRCLGNATNAAVWREEVLVVNGNQITIGSVNAATVTGLSTPVNGTDAVNKAYVDGAVDEFVVQTLATADAATVTYVNNADALKLNLTGGTMSGAIAMSSNKITGLGTPAASDDATPKTYVDTADALRLSLSGGTMSGAIAMGASKITGLGTPTNNDDAASKTYVDTADALKLNLAGGTMTGSIAMGSNRITNLGTPTQAADAATKSYTDAVLPSITGNARKSLLVNDAATGVEWAFPTNTNYQVFTASGTWIRPDKCSMVYVECVGGGGGGSQLSLSSSSEGGGGGGGFAARAMLASTVAGVGGGVTVTVGGGGTGGGGGGGTSSFGTHVKAYGGRAGVADFFVTNTGSYLGLSSNAASINITGISRFLSPNGSGGGYGAPDNAEGGNALFGGGGGSGSSGGAAGVSQHHGNGGVGNNTSGVKGGNGVAPGGGGGGSGGGGGGGDGARGEVRIWAW